MDGGQFQTHAGFEHLQSYLAQYDLGQDATEALMMQLVANGTNSADDTRLNIILLTGTRTPITTLADDFATISGAVAVTGVASTYSGLIESNETAGVAFDRETDHLVVTDASELDSRTQDALGYALEGSPYQPAKSGGPVSFRNAPAITFFDAPTYDEWDEYEAINEPINEQIPFAFQVLSRFDAVVCDTDDPAEPAIDPTAIDRDAITEYLATARGLSVSIDEATQDILDRACANLDEEIHDRNLATRERTSIRTFAIAIARLQLSESVSEDDITRAIAFYRSSLKNSGVEMTTGGDRPDAIAGTGTKDDVEAESELIGVIRSELQRHPDEPGAPLQAVHETMQSEGYTKNASKSLVQTLRDRGDIYSPDRDYVRLV